jgi:hypothetical protein
MWKQWWAKVQPSSSGFRKSDITLSFEFVFLLSFCTFTFTFLYFHAMSFESKPTGLLKTKKKTKKTQKSTDTFPDAWHEMDADWEPILHGGPNSLALVILVLSWWIHTCNNPLA